MSGDQDRLEAWKLEACQSAGLPAAMASRLNGETREAIFTDARVLADQAQPEKPATAEAQALARMALANARQVQEFGPGVLGGKLSPAPVEVRTAKPEQRLVRDDGE